MKKIDFGRMLQQVAKRYPNREAIVNIERNRRFTYQQLDLLTNQICNMFKDRFGLKRDDKYITLLENDNISILGFWMFKGEVGSGWLNYRDAFEEHMWQIDLLEPKVIVLESVLLEKYYSELRRRGIQIVYMDPIEEDKEGAYYFWDLIEKASAENLNITHDADEDIMLYRFTGGTTGKGKCAMYTCNNVLIPAYGLYGLEEEVIPHHTRHLHMTPMSHASGLYILPIYFKGGTSVTMNIPDLKQLCQNIQDEKITSTLLVPTILYRFLEIDFQKQFDLSSLETIHYAASVMNVDKLKGLQEKFGNIFCQCYGSTEAYPPTTILEKSKHIIKTKEDEIRLGSAGVPVADYEIMVVDENGKEVAQGESGEAWIRGTGVIKGYYRNPEKTKEEFHPDGWWKSGDMVRMDEKGYMYIVDRKKDMIITGGFNVYAADVEDALVSHPSVLMAVVVGVPHEDWGEAVHAEVILKEGQSVSEEELIAVCKEKKGKYKAPKSIKFVKELPVTAVGKIIRRKVRDKYWEGSERKVH